MSRKIDILAALTVIREELGRAAREHDNARLRALEVVYALLHTRFDEATA
jgi:hypothetical protein